MALDVVGIDVVVVGLLVQIAKGERPVLGGDDAVAEPRPPQRSEVGFVRRCGSDVLAALQRDVGVELDAGHCREPEPARSGARSPGGLQQQPRLPCHVAVRCHADDLFEQRLSGSIRPAVETVQCLHQQGLGRELGFEPRGSLEREQGFVQST